MIHNANDLADKATTTGQLLKGFLARVDASTQRPLRFRLDSQGDVYAADSYTGLESEQLGLLLPIRHRDLLLILELLERTGPVIVTA